MTNVLNRLRLLLQDENGEIWNDDDLIALINEGQAEYAERTHCLVNSFQLVTDSGVGEYPDDFVAFRHGLNCDDATIFTTTWSKLQNEVGDNFTEVAGIPLFIYNDLSSDGSFKVYPIPDQALIDATDNSPWGIATVDGCSDVWGRLESDEYEQQDIWGITGNLTDFTEAGKIYYARRPVDGVIEVPDELALVYYAGSKAFEFETERQNLNVSASLLGMFDNRVNSYSSPSGIKVQHNNNIGSWF